MNDLPDLAFFSLLARQPTLAAAAQADTLVTFTVAMFFPTPAHKRA